MWLVLCASTDPSALWAYEGLVARGLKPVELVTAEVLAYSLRWEHRLSVRGSSIDITLADGRRINGDGTKGVLNRLQWAPSEHLMAAAPEERQYASQEIYAFLMGWLYSLPQPVLNRPTPQGLSGQWRYPSEWNWLAARAGLATRTFRVTSRDYDAVMAVATNPETRGRDVRTLFTLAGEVIGDQVPTDVITCCGRLAELAGTPLLGIEFDVSQADHWVFLNATASPNLMLGGEALLDALASFFRGKAATNGQAEA